MQTRWLICEKDIAEKNSPTVACGAAASNAHDALFFVAVRGTPGIQHTQCTGVLFFGFRTTGGDLSTLQFG